jgi:hypothetical protein
MNSNMAIFLLKKMKDKAYGKKRIGGSVVGRKVFKREREDGYRRLMEDYFVEESVYGEKEFRRRFRMRKGPYLKIVGAVTKHDEYFKRKSNAARTMGFYPIQKLTAAMRQLCYGINADLVDEYLRIVESTALESFKRLCIAAVEVFEEEYLR